MKETDAIDEYILQHIDEESDYSEGTLSRYARQAFTSPYGFRPLAGTYAENVCANDTPPSGAGNRDLQWLLRTLPGRRVGRGATLHTFEINDEQEDFTRPWLEGSPYAGKIKFYIGDALKLLPGMNITFDLAFVDGDKRKYIEYYEMVLEKLSPGGYIIADNTLWDGHVLEEPHHTDLQTIGIKKFNDLVAADKRVEKVILLAATG